MDNNLIFSKRLRHSRERVGLKQIEMAKKLNIKANTYNGYETGKRVPSLEIARDIASYLNVSLDYLVGLTDTKKFEIKNSKEIHKIINALNELNNIGKVEAVKRMEELSQIPKYTNNKEIYLIAAHNDNRSEEQIKLMYEDLDDL